MVRGWPVVPIVMRSPFVVTVGEGVVVVCGYWLQATVKRKQQLNSVINFVSWRNRFQGQNPLMIII